MGRTEWSLPQALDEGHDLELGVAVIIGRVEGASRCTDFHLELYRAFSGSRNVPISLSDDDADESYYSSPRRANKRARIERD